MEIHLYLNKLLTFEGGNLLFLNLTKLKLSSS